MTMRNDTLDCSSFGLILALSLPHLGSHQLEKRKCNTATCVTQRLADFLVRSSSSIGAVYPPTNVGSNTYGKRDTEGLLSREPQNHAQLQGGEMAAGTRGSVFNVSTTSRSFITCTVLPVPCFLCVCVWVCDLCSSLHYACTMTCIGYPFNSIKSSRNLLVEFLCKNPS